MWSVSLSTRCGATLRRCHSLSLGYSFTMNRRPAGPYPRLELDHNAGHLEYAPVEVDVLDPQLGQLTPAQAGFDGGLHEQSHGVVLERGVDPNFSTVMIRRGFVGTGGVFTPLAACRKVIWSFSAVVRIESRMTLHLRIVGGRAP
jgi:hypothetical protein